MLNMFITNVNLPEIRYVYSSDDFLLMLPYLRGYICSLRVSSYYIQIHVSTIFKYKPVFYLYIEIQCQINIFF